MKVRNEGEDMSQAISLCTLLELPAQQEMLLKTRLLSELLSTTSFCWTLHFCIR